MTAPELLRAIREAGIEIEARAGRVFLRPRSKVTNEIEVWMTQHKALILWAVQRRRPDHLLNEVWLSGPAWERWMEMCDAEERKAMEARYDEAA